MALKATVRPSQGGPKVGRNVRYPDGSGRKHKHGHGLARPVAPYSLVWVLRGLRVCRVICAPRPIMTGCRSVSYGVSSNPS